MVFEQKGHCLSSIAPCLRKGDHVANSHWHDWQSKKITFCQCICKSSYHAQFEIMRCWWLAYAYVSMSHHIWVHSLSMVYSMPQEHLGSQCHLKERLETRESSSRTTWAWRLDAPPHSLAFSCRESRGWLEQRQVPGLQALPFPYWWGFWNLRTQWRKDTGFSKSHPARVPNP